MDPGSPPTPAFAAIETPGDWVEWTVDWSAALEPVALFLASAGVVFLLGWFVVEPAMSRVVRQRNRNNPTIREVVTRWIRLVVVLVAFVVGLLGSGYGYVVGDTALVVAAGTLAVGVAGQTVLGSLVSGLVLVADPEFNVGDYVEWSEGSGTIQSITLRVTRIVTPKGELVTVPNTTLTSEAVTRPYGRSRYRVDQTIGVDYEDDVVDAMEQMKTVALVLDEIADEPDPDVFVESFESDWVQCRVHYWITQPDRQETFEVRSTYATALKDRLESAGITISPPSKRDLEGEVTVEGAV